jgi:hypothetical protein
MKSAIKHILFLLFVALIFGSGQQITTFFYQTEIKNIVSGESSLDPDKKDDHSQASFNDVSIIPAQFSITPKSRTLSFRLSPLSRYIFHEEHHEDSNLHTLTKSILHRQLFVLAEKRMYGYYIYTLRKIVI